MDAGKMNRFVTLQTAAESQGSGGGHKKTWSQLAQVWAQKIPLRGRELFTARQVVADASAIFRIWHRTDLDEKARLIDEDSTVFEIENVAEVGFHEGLDLLCSRVK